MAIDKKIINFKKGEDFTREYNAGNILDKSLVFIDDTHEIVTHKTVFDGNIPDWNANEGQPGFIKNKPDLSNIGSDDSLPPYPNANQIVYTTTDGEVCALYDSSAVKENVYYKGKGYGVVTFKNDLTKVPRICGYDVFDGSDYGKNLKSVILPNNVTGFVDYCFTYAQNLESINIPEGVKEIPQFCFNYTYKLFNINLPYSLESIGHHAFYYSGIESINFKNVIELGEQAFGYTNIKSLYIPGNLKTIGKQCFYQSNFLTTVIIESTTTLGEGCFYHCRLLTNIKIESITNIPKDCFYGCNIRNLRTNASEIGNGAFNNCPIENLILTNSNLKLDNGQFGNNPYLRCLYSYSSTLNFYNTSNVLETIILKSDTLITTLNNGFISDNGVVKVYVKENLLEEYKNYYKFAKDCFHPYFYNNSTSSDTYVYRDNLWTGTQEEYEAITSKDSNTFYFIKED